MSRPPSSIPERQRDEFERVIRETAAALDEVKAVMIRLPQADVRYVIGFLGAPLPSLLSDLVKFHGDPQDLGRLQGRITALTDLRELEATIRSRHDKLTEKLAATKAALQDHMARWGKQ